MTGGSAEGTVEISVLHGISVPDWRIALSEVAAFRALLNFQWVNFPRRGSRFGPMAKG